MNACLHGGTDIDSGGTYGGHLANAVSQGTTTRELVDQALINSYRMRFIMGLFDPNTTSPYDGIKADVIGCERACVRACVRDGWVTRCLVSKQATAKRDQ